MAHQLFPFLRPSTRAYIREARNKVDFSLFDFLHGYVYARWPYLYIGVGTGEHRLARTLAPVVQWIGRLIAPADGDAGNGSNAKSFADTYHGKVVPLDAAKQLVNIHEPVVLKDLEHIIPYATARDIIMKNPEHIVALECPCRTARPDPCLPLDVCLIVGEPFAGFIAEHHRHRARFITREEAGEILEAEHERGHVSHAFFKDAMLGRFYAICNCCSCCCGAMQAQRNGTPMLTSSGYVAHVDAVICAGCERCIDFCQFTALSMRDGVAVVDYDACMGCDVCVDKCDQGALSLVLEPANGEPLEIRELMGGRP